MLRENRTEKGLRASRAYYNQIWARDAFISFLGSNMVEDRSLLDCARDTILTFAGSASLLGQIPNFYDIQTSKPEYGYSGSTDSSCWFIIGLANLFHSTSDRTLLKGPLDAAAKAYRWLRYQDANNVWLIDSPPGADWMDAAVRRTGKTLYNNVLFLAATQCVANLFASAGRSLDGSIVLEYKQLKQRLTDIFHPSLGSQTRIAQYWPRMASAYRNATFPRESRLYFIQFVSFSRIDLHFDTLSNLLCILAGVADTDLRHSILATMKSRKLSNPFPTRNLDPPYRGEGAVLDRAFDSGLPVQHRSIAYSYHNGAVWPFIGGLHVTALYRDEEESAPSELIKLAKANSLLTKGEDVGFNEWISGKSGKPMGQYGQSWNAGTFLAAVQASKGKDPFRFLSNT